MSRSNTTPDLGVMSPASMYSGCVITAVPDKAGLVNISSSSESFPSVTKSTSFGHSPTASTRSGSSTTIVESKKKQGLFGCKAKDNDRPKSSHRSPLQLSPLPPLTPVKAAQFLGVEGGAVRTRSGSLGSRAQYDEFDGLLDSASEKTDSTEEDVVSGPTKPKCLWAAGNRKAQRMLGIAPSREYSIKHGAEPERGATETPAIHSKKGNRVDYNSEPDVHSRALAKPRKRRTRKKAPKSLDRMTPITEMSCDELRSSYHDSEHNPELELISEYERDPSYSGGLPPQPPTPLPFTANTSYELEEGDVSPVDVGSRKHAGAGAKEYAKHSDREVGFSKSKQESPAVVHLRGPLQSFEDRLLDVTEANLAIQRMRNDTNDAARFHLEAKGCCLSASHKAMKKEFVALRPDALVEESDNDVESESDDSKKLVSIRGSIDLEEEPIVDLAELMPCTHITASARKLVDVPPKKPKPTTPSKCEVIPNLLSGVKSPLKSTYIFQHDEKASPFKELICNPYPTRSYPPAKPPRQIRKTKKSNNLCNESRILVENWISTNDPIKQRPLSDRLDIDVLSDQQIPPAPFPKDNNNSISTTTSTPPPPRISSKQHLCLRNGHILHPINLRSIPDEAAINVLDVRPYIRTHSGRKIHIHILVFCDRCGEDVREELWECKLKVCRLVVCKGCAEDLEAEWKKRVIGEWEN
ncbi:hypothetical protein COCMIDRAFT_3854 [Bipolaris oryzae ATCC 44560]|uniref:Uncharacterized protein n=1 Tax=Bipolaris oryzae ATCC 44560 TaxID=930090 RepID=W6ZBG2_COCMI|nr:uncharacterized protein COCMIDRAFT_3854 [Bipolaris oryzae ATCC 44560]EUC47143.1 hypothetical protein COCMIDRAFT_3854 [Bipolaris oryzae ATCC 44560]